MAQSLGEMNGLLRDVTLVRMMSLTTDMRTGECALRLELTDHEHSTRCVELQAEGVTGMTLVKFGGGFTQLAYLQVKDVRGLQHDRVAFELEELEDRRLLLRCRSLIVSETAARADRS
jgi:hypothetical protein